MQTITPHLWCDTQAVEATKWYTSLFPDSEIVYSKTLHNTPSGDCDIVSFTLSGQPFMAISAGPLFKFNPSISFHVKCQTKEEVDTYWNALVEGGTVLMELGEYPFSERYGWLQDKYGVSWQLIFVGEEKITQKITPVMMFVDDVAGKAEDAITLYTSVFNDAPFDKHGESKVTFMTRYEKGEEPDTEGTVKYAHFLLNGMDFGIMDSAHEHKFSFTEALSLIIPCDSQEEIDYFWEKLSSDPESEQCGWCKDKFGVSWQVWPSTIGEMMKNGTDEQIDRVTQAFLPMKKFDISVLEKSFDGEDSQKS
jgi:predicted 3-demethylubiquinone-9 3-methyltransferase (glyoxalase superfamily)